MRLNADFDQPVRIVPEAHEWVASPTPGVTRMMLDRVGDEVARATSLVRYAPNSDFPAHEHGGGEEILVLEGEFADEHGRYPAGTYLRNPVGTRHAPRVGPEGALLFVKLHQFARGDRRQCVLDTREPAQLPGTLPGLAYQALHEWRGECVALLTWPPDARLAPRPCPGGAELFVLRGGLEDRWGPVPEGGWLRLPPGSTLAPRTGSEGATLFLKTGHLGADRRAA